MTNGDFLENREEFIKDYGELNNRELDQLLNKITGSSDFDTEAAFSKISAQIISDQVNIFLKETKAVLND